MLEVDRRRILAEEQGVLIGTGRRSIAMVYPSPYNVGMSSLGYQTLYRILNEGAFGWRAERAFHGDMHTLESGRPVSDHDAIGISLAYELEVFGVVEVLRDCGLEPLASRRPERAPPVIMGGPLTFSNPLPAAPFADAVLIGECETLLPQVLQVFAEHTKREALEIISGWPHVLVPAIHGEMLPEVAAAPNAMLPAYSAIVTPNTELANMLLIEAERGCHRNCTFCVMRRSTNGGMRLAPIERILEIVDRSGARKVGLVGAAVSDHPKIVELLHALVETRGLGVGISSLRADRLNDEFVRLLGKGGYRTLTVASDAPSQRLRDVMQKNIKEKHVLRAAELAKAHGLKTLKVYMMVGNATETDADIDELIRFTRELSRIMPTALGIAPFVPKYNTPLTDGAFAGEDAVQERLDRLRKGLRGAAEVRTTSVREAAVEAALAVAGFAAADAVLAAPSWKQFYKYIQKNPIPRRAQAFVEPFAARSKRPLLKSIVS